jgi:hypothetical protein
MTTGGATTTGVSPQSGGYRFSCMCGDFAT